MLKYIFLKTPSFLSVPKMLNFTLIHPDQVGFIQQGSDNMRLVVDWLLLIVRNLIRLLFFSLTRLWKSFWPNTQVLHFCCACKVWFPPDLQKHSDIPKSRVLCNGILYASFSFDRGARQGCLLSPLIFNLYLELTACSVRQECNIHGLVWNPVKFKIILYADGLFIVYLQTQVFHSSINESNSF